MTALSLDPILFILPRGIALRSNPSRRNCRSLEHPVSNGGRQVHHEFDVVVFPIHERLKPVFNHAFKGDFACNHAFWLQAPCSKGIDNMAKIGREVRQTWAPKVM